MRIRCTFSALMIILALSPFVYGQILKPVDRSKLADVNDKTVNYGDLQLGTVSQPTRDISKSSPVSKGEMKLQDVDLKSLQLNGLDATTVGTPVVSKANFTAKRATVDNKWNDKSTKQLEQTKQKAPITERQIRPFMPGGEEELKKQLNEPH